MCSAVEQVTASRRRSKPRHAAASRPTRSSLESRFFVLNVSTHSLKQRSTSPLYIRMLQACSRALVRGELRFRAGC
jgi:hypothetical protein